MASSALALGTVLMGELSLEEQLGSSVYRARRTRDGRELSMRIVHPRTSQEAAEFLALAATASRVRHPALASVEAYGRIDTERCYIASELIGGQRLDEWADAVGIPPLGHVVELVRRLCVGLQAAARAGVVHDAIHARNVRVQSVPIGSNSRMPVKLLGLGVPALLFNYAQDPDALRFMAPEQLQVLSRSELPAAFRCSAQMNVYSCGALLYYLATGGAPYAGLSAAELLAAQASAPLAPPARINPQITSGLNAVVMRALSLDPSDRFGSAAELGEALAAVFGSVAPPRKREKSSEQPVGEDMFGAEPPTFRTSVSSIAELERAAAFDPAPHFRSTASDTPPQNNVTSEQDDKPTLPPVAAAPVQIIGSGDTAQIMGSGEMRDSVSGVAPIGLFSSSPPHLRNAAPGAAENTNAGAPKATPLAAFSEPPRIVSLEARASSVPPPPTGTRDSQPGFAVATQLSTGATGTQTDIARLKARQWPWPLLAVPLAAAVCLLAFYGVRGLLGPADSGHMVAVVPPKTVAPITPAHPHVEAPAAPQEQAPAVAPGASLPMRPYIMPSELEAAAPDETPEREHDSARGTHRGRRAAQIAARRNNPAPAPAPAAPPARPHERTVTVDEHVEEPAPQPIAAVDASHVKIDEHEATASVVIAPPEPVAPPPPALKVEKALTAPPPLVARVKIDSVEVRGSLPKSQVRHAIERLNSQLKACYAQAAQAAGHNGFGELIVGVEIDERGRARSPRVQGAGLPHLDGCVTETIQHLITGRVPDTGTVTATWKIVFMP
ncbi:MAG TPA: protein kinase [Polyangiales bacterium]|nr:protein kinase [Polyangiales bacterium]